MRLDPEQEYNLRKRLIMGYKRALTGRLKPELLWGWGW